MSGKDRRNHQSENAAHPGQRWVSHDDLAKSQKALIRNPSIVLRQDRGYDILVFGEGQASTRLGFTLTHNQAVDYIIDNYPDAHVPAYYVDPFALVHGRPFNGTPIRVGGPSAVVYVVD